jgi:hypothetical protein
MNREIVIPGGAGVYPLTGDVQSTAGSSTVRVVGLQGLPLENIIPNPGAFLVFNQNNAEWEPIQRACIQVNGLTVSDDYDMSVNATHVSVNGTPVT